MQAALYRILLRDDPMALVPTVRSDHADQFGLACLGVRKGTLVGEGGSKKNRCASK